jgi:MinD superfamily P-loop ATPase
MVIPGKGGVGKSKLIQTMTKNFEQRNVGDCYGKSNGRASKHLISEGKRVMWYMALRYIPNDPRHS